MSRNLSYSAPGRVHVSEATYRLLRHRFAAIPRGEREIKGKGMMATYFLRNEPPDEDAASPPSLPAPAALLSPPPPPPSESPPPLTPPR